MSNFSKKIKLTNGLTVIYEKVDTTNIVAIHLGVKVGSAQETDKESGISHLIEHMVFKGTTSYQAGEIATLVEAHGGELNAYTSWDQTAYYINLPNEHFNLGLNIIKEMAFDATMDPLELQREKEVIIEEILRSQDSPQRVLGEMLFSGFYKKHNYRRSIIGTKKLVNGFTLKQIRHFYKKYYNPQNMVLAVCGNISETDLSHALENTFRFTIRSPITSQKFPVEPPKTRYNVATKGMNINATYLEIGFPAPKLTHKDVPAMDILSHLIGEAETSLFEQITKEKEQLVHNINTVCYTPKQPGIFIISCLVDPKLINKALQSIRRQIEYVKSNLFEQEKIERAKLLAKAQLIYERQTCEGTAKKWITYECMSADYKFDEKYIEEISKLTPINIQKIAQKYLDFTKTTLAILHPKKVKVHVDKSVFSKKPTTQAKRLKRIHRVKDSALYKLDNGIRVIIKENHRLPLVSIKTASQGGLRFETANNNGMNYLLSNIMTRSTTNLNQEQLAEKCEWLAGHISGYSGRNSLGYSFSFLSEKLQQAIPLFRDVMLNPVFDDEEINKEKTLILEAIKNRSDNPAQTCFRELFQSLFKGHPYQRHILGELKSVKNLSASQLKKYFQNIMVPKNMVIAIVGDVNSDQILDLLNSNLSQLKNTAFKNIKIKKPGIIKKPISKIKHQQREQAHIAMGFFGTSIYNEDKHALELISNILSGQGGRLFLELRDRQSLAYSVATTLVEGIETGFFSTYIATDPSKVKTAIKGTLDELSKIREKRISESELERAKNYIIGNQEIEHQKNSSIAIQFALNEIYGLGLESWYEFSKKIKKVTVKDVQRVAQKYIRPERSVQSIVGPKNIKL